MGIFSAIKDKIFGHKGGSGGGGGGQAQAAPSPGAQPQVQATPAPQPQAAPTAEPAVDVEAVLASMAEMQGGDGGNWRTSIVDLLKLLHMDSGLQARRELAEELGVHAGEHGSAEQNTALHRAVMRKLAENGGQVPASFYS
ncbi:DUF3597 domain-containing protein [Phenylobacterium sp. VNQ135]|uniref:DUF3597 domain-containing protein n=1 Tax=Phenylobacterium sp. VNQ135 TaxID=3400922 RepID=UPI003C0E0A2A